MLQNLPGVLFPYSRISLERLDTCHPDLQRLFLALSKTHNISIICGYRGELEQARALKEKKSTKAFGQSKHNVKPSLAVDAVPTKALTLWKHKMDLPAKDYQGFAADVFDVANFNKIKLRWGGDWDMDGFALNDQKLYDFAHWELMEA